MVADVWEADRSERRREFIEGTPEEKARRVVERVRHLLHT